MPRGTLAVTNSTKPTVPTSTQSERGATHPQVEHVEILRSLLPEPQRPAPIPAPVCAPRPSCSVTAPPPEHDSALPFRQLIGPSPNAQRGRRRREGNAIGSLRRDVIEGGREGGSVTQQAARG